METQNWNQTCPFLANDSKVLKNMTEFSISYLYSNFSLTAVPYAYFVVDNTPFPQGGAFAGKDLTIKSHYSAYIEPTKEYLEAVLKLGILLGCLIIFSIACVLFCLYRYRRVQADYISYKSYSQGRRNNNKSFVSNGSGEPVKKSPFSSQAEYRGFQK